MKTDLLMSLLALPQSEYRRLKLDRHINADFVWSLTPDLSYHYYVSMLDCDSAQSTGDTELPDLRRQQCMRVYPARRVIRNPHFVAGDSKVAEFLFFFDNGCVCLSDGCGFNHGKRMYRNSQPSKADVTLVEARVTERLEASRGFVTQEGVSVDPFGDRPIGDDEDF